MTKCTILAVIVLAIFTIEVISQRRSDRQNIGSIAGQGGPSCPEKNGRYPVKGQCDAYIECKDGVGTQELCPDGLLFNAAANVFSFPCQYPIDVDCEGREATQPPQATEDCPHQFGYFRLGNAQSCGQFMNCVDGRGYTFDCPEGLAFNKDSYRCDWPDQVPDCDAEAFLGFTCPADNNVRGLGDSEFRFFRSTNDCQRYYICINNRPRLYNCGEGAAFNDLINACDGVENVTSCSSTFEGKGQQPTPINQNDYNRRG